MGRALELKLACFLQSGERGVAQSKGYSCFEGGSVASSSAALAACTA
jgi:hypothetical protein